jgi:hypothetical protein
LRDRPDDELAKLALADWCLEQPDEATQARAEQLRLSLALGRLPWHGDEARRLRERIEGINERRRMAWLGPLREIGHRCTLWPGGRVWFEVTGGRIDRACELKVAPPSDVEFVWASSFLARALTLDHLCWLAGTFPRGCVRSLQVEVPNSEGVADVLAAGPWMQGLRTLSLYSHSLRLDDGEAVRLAGCDRLRDLTELSLSSARLRPEGCAALAGSPHLKRLRRLTLRDCDLWPAAVEALCSAAFPSLEALSLERNELSHSAGEALAEWPGLAAVRQLNLDGNQIGNAGLEALSRSPHLAGLRALSARNCLLTNRGLKTLARASLGRLESLDVRDNLSINDAGLMAISKSSSLSSLRELRHSRESLREQTMAVLEARFGKSHGPSPH